MTFGIILAFLAIVAGVFHRVRQRRYRSPAVTDELIRRIEEEGRVEVESPLDRKEIRQEEERFWRESWDEPEEW